MKYEVTFSKQGNIMSHTIDNPDVTGYDIIDILHLEEDDIDWYKIEKSN